MSSYQIQVFYFDNQSFFDSVNSDGDEYAFDAYSQEHFVPDDVDSKQQLPFDHIKSDEIKTQTVSIVVNNCLKIKIIPHVNSDINNEIHEIYKVTRRRSHELSNDQECQIMEK